MITMDLARRLRDAGLPWGPASGDRFVIPDRDMDDDVFVVSEMTIEVQDVRGDRLVKFNGTTEWALDSVPASQVLWLPRESQLRVALGVRFARLEAVGGGFAVVLDDGARYVDLDAERAYARAVLAVLEGASDRF